MPSEGCLDATGTMAAACASVKMAQCCNDAGATQRLALVWVKPGERRKSKYTAAIEVGPPEACRRAPRATRRTIPCPLRSPLRALLYLKQLTRCTARIFREPSVTPPCARAHSSQSFATWRSGALTSESRAKAMFHRRLRTRVVSCRERCAGSVRPSPIMALHRYP